MKGNVYSRVMRLCTVLAGVVTATISQAGGLVVQNGSPRSIGRAGTGTVGDDGAGALLVNPAAMARREGKRGELGVAFVDDEIVWNAVGAPPARNQSPSDFAPTGAVVDSIGPWVFGLGAMTSSISDRALRPPSDLPPSELGHQFDFRYTGIAGAQQRDTVTLGVSRRIGDNFAVGAAVGVSRVTISETRRIWAGFSGRDALTDPNLDVELRFAGVDWFVPSAVIGGMFVTDQAPLELGASVAFSQAVDFDGDVAALAGDAPNSPRVRVTNPRSSFRMRQPVTLRAGARYLGDRFVAEIGGDLWVAPRAAASTTWDIAGVRVSDRSGVIQDVNQVPSRLSLRTHGAARAAVDVELIGGFLWATAGYAYQVAGVAETRQSPSFGDLGGHTMALGLEGTAGGFTFTLGMSRTWSTTRMPDSALRLDNPFTAGDTTVPLGEYDGSVDQIGVLVDVELDPGE